MDIKILIPIEDVLTTELGDIYGGSDPINDEPIKIECKSDGVVEIPPTKVSMTIF